MSNIFLVQLSAGKTINLAHIFDFSDESEGGKSVVSIILTNGEEFVYEGEDADAIFRELDFFLQLSASLKARYAATVAAEGS